MNANLRLRGITSILCLIVSSISFAGGMEGGGGGAIVCRNTQGQMISAEIFDLFEGRALYGYLPKLDASDYKAQARSIAKEISEAARNSFFINETERVLDEVRFLPPDASLNPINDIGSIIKPSNCEIFQAAFYLPNKRIYFDSTVWSLLNETNRAALIIHEVVYAFLRSSNGDKTSIRARQYVSYLYSGQKLQHKWSEANGEAFEACATSLSKLNDPDTPRTAFQTRLNPDGTWKISFVSFHGSFVFGKTEINSKPGVNYSWPISNHQTPDGEPGGGAVPLKGKLTFDVDEGWEVDMLVLDLDSNEHTMLLKIAGDWKWVHFSCNAFNLPKLQ
ncbi:MAG: hypothetical protein IPM97_01440 [Bdellovibrionaceae bacterium]|nr:hypothetical protein [Pseudobdellovibrionaceae bacterium]